MVFNLQKLNYVNERSWGKGIKFGGIDVRLKIVNYVELISSSVP